MKLWEEASVPSLKYVRFASRDALPSLSLSLALPPFLSLSAVMQLALVTNANEHGTDCRYLSRLNIKSHVTSIKRWGCLCLCPCHCLCYLTSFCLCPCPSPAPASAQFSPLISLRQVRLCFLWWQLTTWVKFFSTRYHDMTPSHYPLPLLSPSTSAWLSATLWKLAAQKVWSLRHSADAN